MTLVHGLQTVLIIAVGALVFERARTLLYVAPVAEPFLKALRRCAREGRAEDIAALAKTLPHTSAAQVALTGLEGGRKTGVAAMEEALLDVRAAALKRLRALRACATLGSTLGLLGAIVALVGGFSGRGLLALQAGLAERVALNQALLTMGIGVATSAVCFYAFGILRRAALLVISQATQVARELEPLLE